MLHQFLQTKQSQEARQHPLNFNVQVLDRKIIYITLVESEELIKKRQHRKTQPKQFKGFKNILAIINVISQQNYQKKIEEILKLISENEKANELIREVFQILVKKGTIEKLYRNLYSVVCKSIINIYKGQQKKPVRKQLQDILQEIFFAFIDQEGYVQEVTIEDKEINARLTEKYLGNLHFISCLHNNGLISRNILQQIFTTLLEQHKNNQYKDHIIEAMCNCYSSLSMDNKQKLENIRVKLVAIERQQMSPRGYHLLQIALGEQIEQPQQMQIIRRDANNIITQFKRYQQERHNSKIETTPEDLYEFIIQGLEFKSSDMELAFRHFISACICHEVIRQSLILIKQDIESILIDAPKANEYLELIQL